MRPGSRERIPTVEGAVAGAAQAVDPDGRNDAVTALVRSFEGDERQATTPEDLSGELRTSADALDPEGLEPPIRVAAATASWIATNPSSIDDPETAIREGVRLFYAGEVPAGVEDWLAARGLS